MLFKAKSLVHKSQFTAVSSGVQQNQTRRWSSEKPYGHVIGQRKGAFVQMELNRGHKNNFMTPLMIQEIKRFFESYEIDDAIQMIWLQSSHKEVFSKGTDMKYLLTSLIQQRHQEAQNYLQQVQGIAHTFASYNKPMITYVNGQVSGSTAASIVSVLPFTITSPDTTMQINDTFFGFIPHGGSTYVLSRLPRELGLYLALTGEVLNQNDLQTLGLTSYELQKDLDEVQDFTFQLLSNGVLPDHTNNAYGNMFQWWRKQYIQGQEKYLKRIDHELQFRTLNSDPDIAEDPRSVLSEVIHKNELVKDANWRNWQKPAIQQNIQNYLGHYETEVLKPLEYLKFIGRGIHLRTTVENPGIVRCFSANTIEEIIDRLNSEGSEWAKKTKQRLQLRSPLILKLTLKLLREAETSTWQQCLERELTVGTKLLSHPDFVTGVQRIGKKTEMQKWTHSTLQEVYDSEVDSYFQDKVKLDTKVVENSLHPIKEFYSYYPDNVRKFLNEENLYGDWQTRANQEVDVLSFLKNNGIPFEDQTVSAAEIRQTLTSNQLRERSLQLKISRLFQLCSSIDNLRVYHQSRTDYIESKFKSTSIELINDAIKEVFEEGINKRYQAYKHIAQLGGWTAKSTLFSDVRNTILNRRLVSSSNIGVQNWGDTNRMSFFPKDDKVSFYNVYNESLEDSTLFKKLYKKLQGEKIPKEKNPKKDYERFILDGCQTDGENKFNRLLLKFDEKYGDPAKYQDLEKYTSTLIEIGNKSRELKEQMSKVPNLQEYLKVTQKVNEYDIIRNIFTFAKDEEQKQSEGYQTSIEKIEELIKSTKEEISELYFDRKLKELQELNGDSNLNYTQKTLKARFEKFIESEPSLKQVLGPILQKSKNKSLSLFQNKFEQLLLAIYSQQFKKFTDEKNRLVKLKGGILDDAIHSHIENDLNKLLEPDVMFAFAYFTLQEINRLYQGLYKIGERIPKHEADYQQQMQKQVNQIFGLQLTAPEEFTQLMLLSNQLLQCSATLYEVYKESIHFASEKALLTLIQIREQKRLGQEEDIVVSAIQRAQRLNKNKPLWSKESINFYIENEAAGLNDAMNYSWQKRLNDELKEWRKGAFDHTTGIYERRAWYLLRQNTKKTTRDWIPGAQHFLQRLDLVTAQAQRTEIISQNTEELDNLEQSIPQSHMLPREEWFKQKVVTAVRELMNLRRRYEEKISQSGGKEALEIFDQELAELLNIDNFKQTLLRSLDYEMDQLSEVARYVQQQAKTKRDSELQSQIRGEKQPQQKLPDNIPLFLTATLAPVTFSSETAEMQYLPTTSHLNLETENPHPLKRSRVVPPKQKVQNLDELHVRLRKLNQELGQQSEPMLVAMHDQDLLALQVKNELEYLSERVKLKNEIRKIQ